MRAARPLKFLALPLRAFSRRRFMECSRAGAGMFFALAFCRLLSPPVFFFLRAAADPNARPCRSQNFSVMHPPACAASKHSNSGEPPPPPHRLSENCSASGRRARIVLQKHISVRPRQAEKAKTRLAALHDGLQALGLVLARPVAPRQRGRVHPVLPDRRARVLPQPQQHFVSTVSAGGCMSQLGQLP